MTRSIRSRTGVRRTSGPQRIVNAQRLQSELDEWMPRFTRAVRPLFAADERRGFPELVGSCVLLRLDGMSWLVTAGHAHDYFEATESSMYVGGAKDVVLVTGESFKWGDPFDVLAVPLDPGIVEKLGDLWFVDVSEIDVGDRNSAEFTQCMSGYPLARFKQREALDLQRAHLKVKPSHLFTALDVTFDMARLGAGLSPATHLTVHSDGRIVHPSGKGLATHGPLKGMSGGALWCYPRTPTFDTVQLSALLLENHPKYQVALAVRMSWIVRRLAEVRSLTS